MNDNFTATQSTPSRRAPLKVYEYELHYLSAHDASGLALIEATSMRNAKKELAMDVRGAVITAWCKKRLQGWNMGGRV